VISHVRAEPARANRSLEPAMAIQPAQARRKRDSRESNRGNNQVEEEGRGLKAALGSNDSSQNNPAYKLDCWWDMETECGQGREDRRGYVCNSETGSTYRRANTCARTRSHVYGKYTVHIYTHAYKYTYTDQHPFKHSVISANSTMEVELHEYAWIFTNRYGIRREYTLVCEFT